MGSLVVRRFSVVREIRAKTRGWKWVEDNGVLEKIGEQDKWIADVWGD